LFKEHPDVELFTAYFEIEAVHWGWPRDLDYCMRRAKIKCWI